MKPDAVPPQKPDMPDDPDALAALIDELMSAGTQHLNLEAGSEMRIRTVNSTDCGGRPGACAVPNFAYNDEEPESEDDSGEDDF